MARVKDDVVGKAEVERDKTNGVEGRAMGDDRIGTSLEDRVMCGMFMSVLF